jgi:hypothetical protein
MPDDYEHYEGIVAYGASLISAQLQWRNHRAAAMEHNGYLHMSRGV